MPTINLTQLRPKPVKYKSEHNYSKYYNSKGWKSLRNKYYKENPLCEECLKKGIIKAAVHVHHKIPFGHATNENAKWSLLLDENNLESVCTECHYKLHEKL